VKSYSLYRGMLGGLYLYVMHSGVSLHNAKVIRDLYMKNILTFLAKIIIFRFLTIYVNNLTFYYTFYCLSNSSNVPIISQTNDCSLFSEETQIMIFQDLFRCILEVKMLSFLVYLQIDSGDYCFIEIFPY